MAIQGRNDLEGLIGSNIPTNNSKQITAQDLREVLESLNISKYNLADDELKELIYEGKTTLKEKLAGLFREVIKRGSFSGLDVGGHQIGETFDTDEVIVESATVTAANSADTVVRVVFKPEAGNIQEKVIIPIFHFTGSNGDASNDIGSPVIKIMASTYLDIAISEFRGQLQTLKVEFIIL